MKGHLRYNHIVPYPVNFVLSSSSLSVWEEVFWDGMAEIMHMTPARATMQASKNRQKNKAITADLTRALMPSLFI